MTLEPELTIERDVLALDTAAKRALIEKELRDNPNRSDRAIAGAVGNKIDHKTVGAARERLGLGDLVASSSARVIDIVAPRACPPPPGVADAPKYDPFDPKEGDMVIPHQPAIAVYENTSGAVVIIQAASDYQGEDPIILVRPENLDALIVRLRKFLP
jgi:hypothetical protein